MRKRLLVIGIVVALAAIAVWYVPLQTVTTSDTLPLNRSQVIGLQAPLDVIGPTIGYTLHWTAVSAATVSVYRCGTNSACTSISSGNLVARGTGPSGSLSWSGPQGNYFHIVASAPVSITIEELEPLLGGSAGVAMLVFGGFLVVLGVRLPALPEPEEAPVPRFEKDEFDVDPPPRSRGSQ
jgi:hypothetical protein